MKQIITKPIILFSLITFIYGFTFSSDGGKIHLKVSKFENGEKSVFEKTYENIEALKADTELKSFDLLIDDWITNQNIIIGKRIEGSDNFTWIGKDENIQDGPKHIIIKKK